MASALVGLPPGPRTPAVWQLLHYSQSPLTFIESCRRQYGDPFTVRLAGYGSFVMLSDPDAIRDVFRGSPRELHSGEGNEFASITVGKNSVLVLDEEPHARQRRILLPPFKGERMRSFFAAMQANTIDAIRSWPIGPAFGMVEPMKQITLRVILQAVLGLTPGAQLDDFAAKVRALLRFGQSRYTFIIMNVVPLGWCKNFPWLPFFRQLRALDVALFAYLDERRRAGPTPDRDDVLTDLLAATHEDGTPISNQEIRDAVVTLLIAGFETTSLALAWALEQIVPRADVVQQIEDELQRITAGGLPRAEDVHQFEYLDAAIHESLRLRTIVPFVVRLTKSRFMAGSREYPPGVLLCPCNHLVHRRPDLYPEPELFRPERFLERRYSATEWFPFGGGNRMCLGMAFALYEMKVVLSTIFAQVRLRRPPGSYSHPVRRGITLAPSDEAKMNVTERRSL